MPYGISPRIGTEAVGSAWDATREGVRDFVSRHVPGVEKDQGDPMLGHLDGESCGYALPIHANAGIPADHNLTIAEAILMYGPDYARAPMSGIASGWSTTNFQPQNKDWFYTVLSPLTDFVLDYRDQRLIALGWGDAERFIGTGGLGSWGAMLPRAVESVSDGQLALFDAVKTNRV